MITSENRQLPITSPNGGEDARKQRGGPLEQSLQGEGGKNRRNLSNEWSGNSQGVGAGTRENGGKSGTGGAGAHLYNSGGRTAREQGKQPSGSVM